MKRVAIMAALGCVVVLAAGPVAAGEGGGGDGGTAPPASSPGAAPRATDNWVALGTFEDRLSSIAVLAELFDRPMFNGKPLHNDRRIVHWTLEDGTKGTMRFLNDGRLIFAVGGVEYEGTWRFRGNALAITVPILDGGKERTARVVRTERSWRRGAELRSETTFEWGGFQMRPETLR